MHAGFGVLSAMFSQLQRTPFTLLAPLPPSPKAFPSKEAFQASHENSRPVRVFLKPMTSSRSRKRQPGLKCR